MLASILATTSLTTSSALSHHHLTLTLVPFSHPSLPPPSSAELSLRVELCLTLVSICFSRNARAFDNGESWKRALVQSLPGANQTNPPPTTTTTGSHSLLFKNNSKANGLNKKQRYLKPGLVHVRTQREQGRFILWVGLRASYPTLCKWKHCKTNKSTMYRVR